MVQECLQNLRVCMENNDIARPLDVWSSYFFYCLKQTKVLQKRHRAEGKKINLAGNRLDQN